MEKYRIIFETYRRIHSGDHSEDTEKGKIAADKSKGQKLGKKADGMMKKVLSASGEGDVYDGFLTTSYEAQRRSKNSARHKKRLKELMKNDEF